MKKKRLTETERFLALTDAQKDAEVARLVALPPSAWKPLNEARRKQWTRLKRKMRMGRPVVGAGAKQIAVTVERELLKRVDRFAKTHKMKRSQIIAQGMELVMKRAG